MVVTVISEINHGALHIITMCLLTLIQNLQPKTKALEKRGRGLKRAKCFVRSYSVKLNSSYCISYARKNHFASYIRYAKYKYSVV